jgi:hypothetical protein
MAVNYEAQELIALHLIQKTKNNRRIIAINVKLEKSLAYLIKRHILKLFNLVIFELIFNRWEIYSF